MATWTQTTPSVEPVTLAEAKSHLRVTGTAEDVYLHQLIQGAREQVEGWTGRALITRTVTLDLDAWEARSPVQLMFPPVASITSVTGYDNDGNTTVVSSSNYYLSGSQELVEAPNTSGWMEDAERRYWGLRVVYSAGYGAGAESVPYALRRAILTLIADMYEIRQSEVPDILRKVGVSWRAMARPYRVNKLTEVY